MTRFPLKIIAVAAFLLVGVISALVALNTPSARADSGAIDLGADHACAVAPSGDLRCWGGNRSGQLGETTEETSYRFVSAGSHSTCAIHTDGALECWGSLFSGRFALDPTPEGKYEKVSISGHICALTVSGSIRCWGTVGGDAPRVPLGKYTDLSIGSGHGCGLTVAGQIKCWGDDEHGPGSAPQGTFIQVSAGYSHTCGVREDGRIECWGENYDGQLNAPEKENFKQVVAGTFATCALTVTGGVECWGSGFDGIETISQSGHAYVTLGGERAGGAVCAITTTGALDCVGDFHPPTDLEAPGSIDLASLALGGEQEHVAGLTTDRLVQRYHVSAAARLYGPTGGTVSSSATDLPAGSAVTLTATPDDGYRFVRWDGDASGNQNPLTLRPNAHIFVAAVFEPVVSEYRVSAGASPAAGGDVRGLGNGVFEQGEEAVLTALPSDGYRFVRWRGDVSGADNPLVFFVARDVSVTAEFQPLDEQEEEDPPIHDPSCSVDDLGVLGLTYYDEASLPDGRCRDRINGGYAKIYRFRVDEPTELTIQQDADGFYPLFYLIDTSNTLHAEAEGLLSGSVARATATLTSGSYDLIVTTQDTNESGSYELDLLAGTAKSPLVRPGELSETESAVTDTGRVTLFTSRTFPDQNWQIGQPVNLTLPAARFGSGFYTYTIKYEWNGDQTWTPAGVVFDRNTLRFFGTPRLTLDPNPALRRFTVFLRADDRLHSDEWDELSFAVDLQAATPSPSVAQAVPPPLAFPRISIPPPTPEPGVETADAVAARIAARMRSDGRPEFALALVGAPLKTRTWLEIPSISANRQTTAWLMSPDVILNGEQMGRISVRQAANGQLEIGFIPASGSAPILPQSRFLYSPVTGSKGTHLSAVIRIPAPQGCRASESDNGIAFPTRRVKLHANHATEYRVSGLGTTGGRVTYLVCADNQRITDNARDKALFTVGYFYSTAPEFDFRIDYIQDQVETAERGLRIYQHGFKERAWANIVRGTAVASYAALSLYFHSPQSLEEALAVSLKEVAEIADVPVLSKVLSTAQSASPTKAIRLTRGVLEDLAEEPHEVVAKIALQHVYSAVGAGQPWLNATRGARVGDDMLFFPSAHLNRTLEYLIAAGAVGDVLATAVKHSNVAAWKEALHATIPSQLDEELWFLWDAGSQLLDGGLESLHEWFYNYPDYKQLSNTLQGATVIVAQRHQELAVRLGLSALPIP